MNLIRANHRYYYLISLIISSLVVLLFNTEKKYIIKICVGVSISVITIYNLIFYAPNFIRTYKIPMDYSVIDSYFKLNDINDEVLLLPVHSKSIESSYLWADREIDYYKRSTIHRNIFASIYKIMSTYKNYSFGDNFMYYGEQNATSANDRLRRINSFFLYNDLYILETLEKMNIENSIKYIIYDGYSKSGVKNEIKNILDEKYKKVYEHGQLSVYLNGNTFDIDLDLNDFTNNNGNEIRIPKHSENTMGYIAWPYIQNKILENKVIFPPNTIETILNIADTGNTTLAYYENSQEFDQILFNALKNDISGNLFFYCDNKINKIISLLSSDTYFEKYSLDISNCDVVEIKGESKKYYLYTNPYVSD